ncbi:MAG: phosphotransferase [Clostridia bacterium]|nr:phosphotransferase [Clostridia bacterium]
MKIPEQATALYALDNCEFFPVPGHDGGRNKAWIIRQNGEKKYVLRVSDLDDRAEEDYLAETEFIHYLAANSGPVADVIPSIHNRLVEHVDWNGKKVFVILFSYAKGIFLYDNGYRYREGASLEEYFFNTGRTLGAIHRLSKQYVPSHHRPDYFDKYNMDYLGKLIPDNFSDLKKAIADRLDKFKALPKDKNSYGLVHFDYSDGNYHIDMSTGEITVFDFDNCMTCWYLFDLANLWTHGEGWCRGIPDPKAQRAYMWHYFNTILEGYRAETDISEELLAKLPLFIDMVLIESIVDAFECAVREGEELDFEDIEDAAECLIQGIPYAGIGEA